MAADTSMDVAELWPRPRRWPADVERPTEPQTYQGIVEAARLGGWRVMHQRPARTMHGYRTALQGDAGFPDFVFVNARQRRMLFTEIKATRGKGLDPAQAAWGEAIIAAGVPYEVIWVPEQLAEFRQRLVDLGTAPRGIA